MDGRSSSVFARNFARYLMALFRQEAKSDGACKASLHDVPDGRVASGCNYGSKEHVILG